MGKFKEFLIVEDIGLGDLGLKLDKFYNSSYLNNKISGSFISGNNAVESPTLGFAENLPSTDITVPKVEKTGRITHLFLKKNPIYVRLSDGTEAFFTYDEYRKITGKPEIGKTMTMIFQRHPGDQSSQGSKINKAIVLD